jgi:hypothetical protein
MVSIPALVSVAVSVYILLMVVAILYLTYLSTKQGYEIKTEEENSAT